MRTTEEIKADIAIWEETSNSARYEMLRILNMELMQTITDGIPLDRLEEICNAECKGQCVVLPCKAGDTVYRIWVVDGREPVISPHKMVSEAMICQWKTEFGKTVFLTYAEAGLKGSVE